ncbi:MAG TPA: C10 family peptidase [Bacteroidales bacterium]|jgi:hypothetical protein|nr:C10 family peptidase [Bacteroidales bacterium]HOS57320.1 C10 family peptidase [Bacteroidales bacterium]HPY80556.1 C10 family peptidase [Bacteroidales bacterium]HQA86336.1 C10 family peptidase [Bacteroidales bacterium]
MKKTITLVFLLVTFAFGFSMNISVEQAQRVAKNFIHERYVNQDIRIQMEDFTLQYTETDENGEPIFYRFNIKDVGFIMISATNQAAPVLAYSLEGVYKPNPASEFYIEKYKKQIIDVKQRRARAFSKNIEDWNRYLSEDFTPIVTRNPYLDPLITTRWNQDVFYNTYCPFDPTIAINDQRSVVGCVALTMAVLRDYYRYPTKGVGGVSYYPTYQDGVPVYPRQTVDFSKQTYNYDAITDQPNNYNGELAKLIYHCGVSALITYGYGYDPADPGMPNGTSGNGENAVRAFRNNWNFDERVHIVDAEAILLGNNANYTKWGDTLKTELNKLRPIYYSATTAEGAAGHAWILDGYDAQNLFHMNWGWGGFGNGYYQLNFIVDPSGGGLTSFNTAEKAIFKLIPKDTNHVKPDTSFTRNTASFGVITDGPGHLSYKNNCEQRWVIATPKATSYTFRYAKFKTEMNKDVVRFYNARTNALLQGPISGHYLSIGATDDYNNPGLFPDGMALPSSFTLYCDSVLVVFTSDNQNTDNGFVIYYNANLASAPACTPQTGSFLNVDEGTLSDGAGNYRAESGCSWRVKPSASYGLTKLTFAFTKFDLKAGDFVDVFDMTGTNPVLFKRFDINNIPSGPFTCNFLDIKVEFKTDNWQEGEGFVLKYGGTTEIDENSGLNDLSIYPNPATNVVNVEFSTENPENITFNIVDLTGKLIYTEQVNHQGGNLKHQFAVSNLSKGFYFLRIETNTGKTIRKFIVE